jgi:hypothetical protein
MDTGLCDRDVWQTGYMCALVMSEQFFKRATQMVNIVLKAMFNKMFTCIHCVLYFNNNNKNNNPCVPDFRYNICFII